MVVLSHRHAAPAGAAQLLVHSLCADVGARGGLIRYVAPPLTFTRWLSRCGFIVIMVSL